jgi:regulatory protein
MIPPELRLEHALESCYRYLSRGERSVAQVRRHLERRQIDDRTISAAVAELEREGYLDDARFARCFAQDRRTLDAWGRERITRQLLAAGIGEELIEATLAEWADDDELGAAVALLHRRLGAPPSTNAERERALGLLLRRGYRTELAYDAVRAFERAFTESFADCA